MFRIVSRQKIANSLAFSSLLLVSVIGIVPSTNGQSVSNPDIRFSLEANSKFGILTYVPEQWGNLRLRLENRGNIPRDLLCTTYFDEDPTLQFGRQIWLPAHSRLSISHPALFPKADELQNNTANLHSLVIERSSGNEAVVNSDLGQLLNDRPMLVTPTMRNTGVVAGWKSTDVVPQDELDLIVASRVSQGLNNKVTFLTGHFLPDDETDLNYLDHIVLAENRLVDDFAALAAMRRWLHAGGGLWIMLDRTDSMILERLFGDQFQGHVVDRVGLTSVRVDRAPSLTVPDGEPGETIVYDEPVEMARMVVSGMRVWNSVDGWPAAATMDYGEGRVLITTLGPRGWIKPTPPSDERIPEERQPNSESAFVPVSPMEDLAAYVLGKRESATLPHSDLEPIVKEYVSYRIPTWSLIVGMLVVFLLSLFGLGIWLWRSEHLEHFGWSGSLLAVVCGVLLTGIGLGNRHRVPETIASVQLAQAISGTDDVRSHGTIGVYRAEGSRSPIQASQGGKLRPDLTLTEGSTRRMVTTDLGTFHWEGLPQPAGLQIYPYATSRSFANRIEARATMDANGIIGRYSGPSATGADAVLATRYGRMGVQLSPTGEFTVGADDVFETDQYLDASFLGDVQDRRRRMLQELFGNRSWKDALDQPQLLLWVNDWKHGFQFGDVLNRQGETLLILPLEISRPPTGTEVLIPSPLLSFATCRPPDGSLPAGFWDDARGEWQERSGPSSTWLSFQIPRSLLPLKPTKARLEAKVLGPMGRLEIMGVKNESVVTLETVNDPVGTLLFEIDDPEVLTVAENGELKLGVSAGVAERPEPPGNTSVAVASSESASLSPMIAATIHANYWKIESLSLKLWAKTAESTEEN